MQKNLFAPSTSKSQASQAGSGHRTLKVPRTINHARPVARMSDMRTREWRNAFVGALAQPRKMSWPMKIAAFLFLAFFAYLFFEWAVWAFHIRVLPWISNLRGR